MDTNWHAFSIEEVYVISYYFSKIKIFEKYTMRYYL